MATEDLRFFQDPAAPLLPDGQPRRGMSVVAALSDLLTHTNRRRNGSWTQRYEHGVPVTDLEAVEPSDSTGTTVRFHPDPTCVAPTGLTAADLTPYLTFPHPRHHCRGELIAGPGFGPICEDRGQGAAGRNT
jgi:DNA gyrase subunit B